MGHLIKKAPHTIVIFRALQLGDLLCTVPAFRALRGAYPHAHITLVSLPWASAFVDRFSNYLDQFIEFPGWPGLPERAPDIDQVPAFLQDMQRLRFDLALQMQGSGGITNPITSLFGARQAAGYYLIGQFHPHTGLYFPYPEGESEIRVFLHLLERLGIPAQDEQLEFPVSAAEQEEYQRLRHNHLLEPGRIVVLHPGARDSTRRWPPEKFAGVGDGLAAAGFRIVLTGSEPERDLTGAVRQAMRFPALDLAGQTGLGVLALLLGDARLLVSNDTGVSHVAAAVRAPSLILYSASDPQRWRPLNHQLHRAILNAPRVSSQQVLREAEILLKEEHNNAKQPIL